MAAVRAAGTGTKSAFVIGSLYFFLRNFSWTNTSSVGGGVLAYFFSKSPIARVYCRPRKRSSSSFSRCAVCFHTGIATVIITAMTPNATSSATIA